MSIISLERINIVFLSLLLISLKSKLIPVYSFPIISITIFLWQITNISAENIVYLNKHLIQKGEQITNQNQVPVPGNWETTFNKVQKPINRCNIRKKNNSVMQEWLPLSILFEVNSPLHAFTHNNCLEAVKS